MQIVLTYEVSEDKYLIANVIIQEQNCRHHYIVANYLVTLLPE